MFNSWGKTVDEVANTTLNVNLNNSRCLVVLSGGMDSATCLNIAKAAYGENNVSAISFNYGQKHTKELECARRLILMEGVPHTLIELADLSLYFSSALLKDSEVEIPLKPTEGVPPTYVPFRNTIMLSIAAGYAESWGYDRIIYGANIIDYSGYPDCRPEYIEQMNNLLKVASPNKEIIIEAPIIYLTKADVVNLGTLLKVRWELTWSCYRGEKWPCGNCPSCAYRLKGFSEAGMVDPLKYGAD